MQHVQQSDILKAHLSAFSDVVFFASFDLLQSTTEHLQLTQTVGCSIMIRLPVVFTLVSLEGCKPGSVNICAAFITLS